MVGRGRGWDWRAAEVEVSTGVWGGEIIDVGLSSVINLLEELDWGAVGDAMTKLDYFFCLGLHSIR